VWALSPENNLEGAIHRLKAREGCLPEAIHLLPNGGSHSRSIPPIVAGSVGEWLSEHRDIDYLVWTGLTSNWNEPGNPGKKYGHFSTEVAMKYLLTDLSPVTAGRAKAEEYVRKAPPWVDTEVRRRAIAEGWSTIPLPANCEIVEP
jgi:hypothetical protein